MKLDELGVSVPAVLREACLDAGLASQPRTLLDTEELFSLWRAIGKISADPAIGLRLGNETKTERFTCTGIVALSSNNFADAIDKIARYKRLTCPEEVVQRTRNGEWSIQFRWLMAHEPEPAVIVECAFAYVLSIARHGTGNRRLKPLRVELVEPRIHLGAIARHFGCDVVCPADRNAIVFQSSDMQLPFVTRNSELLAVLAPQFERDLAEVEHDENFAERVRRAVQHKLTGRRPTIDDVADTLHISPRTLQRRLQDLGYSFHSVLEDVRRQLARHYLNNSNLELNEAAYLLGYEDGNSFVRAFRAWEGVPPATWREQQRVRSAS